MRKEYFNLTKPIKKATRGVTGPPTSVLTRPMGNVESGKLPKAILVILREQIKTLKYHMQDMQDYIAGRVKINDNDKDMVMHYANPTESLRKYSLRIQEIEDFIGNYQWEAEDTR